MTPGQIAYESFHGWEYDNLGLHSLPWDSRMMDANTKEAWEFTAKAVIEWSEGRDKKSRKKTVEVKP